MNSSAPTRPVPAGRALLVVALAACTFMTAACGSTVRLAPTDGVALDAVDPTGAGTTDGLTVPGSPSGPAAPGSGGSGVTAPSSGSTGSTGSTGGTGTGGTSPSRPGTTGGSTGATGNAGGSGGNGAGSGGNAGGSAGAGQGGTPAGDPSDGSAPGVTADTITVGLSYTVNGGAANSAIGIDGVSQGDGRRNYEALVGWVNANGGVAGRSLEPIFYEMDALSTQSISQLEQAECAYFTQDHRVYAALLGNRGENALQCYAQAGTPLAVTPGVSAWADSTFDRYPLLVDLDSASLTSIARYYVPGLDSVGYFDPEALTGGAKVGLVTYDDPNFVEAVEGALVPGMAAAGQAFDQIAWLRPLGSTAEAGSLQAEVANTVLRFNAAGIDHVMFMEEGSALLAILFMTNADSQAYRPQYGLNTGSGPQAISTLVPAGQLDNAAGVGHFDLFDVAPPDHDPSARRALCDEIFSAAGIAHDDLNARAVAYLACDSVLSFADAVNAGSGPIAADRIVRGLEAVGQIDTALVGPATFSATKHHGASRYRPTRFASDCSCFRAAGPWQPIPTR